MFSFNVIALPNVYNRDKNYFNLNLFTTQFLFMTASDA